MVVLRARLPHWRADVSPHLHRRTWLRSAPTVVNTPYTWRAGRRCNWFPPHPSLRSSPRNRCATTTSDGTHTSTPQVTLPCDWYFRLPIPRMLLIVLNCYLPPGLLRADADGMLVPRFGPDSPTDTTPPPDSVGRPAPAGVGRTPRPPYYGAYRHSSVMGRHPHRFGFDVERDRRRWTGYISADYFPVSGLGHGGTFCGHYPARSRGNFALPAPGDYPA